MSLVYKQLNLIFSNSLSRNVLFKNMWMIPCWSLLIIFWIKCTSRVESKMRISGHICFCPRKDTFLLRKLVGVYEVTDQCTVAAQQCEWDAGWVHSPWTTVEMPVWALVSILTLVRGSKEAFRLTTFPERGRIRVTFAVTSSLREGHFCLSESVLLWHPGRGNYWFSTPKSLKEC